jgi:hypothetical protein
LNGRADFCHDGADPGRLHRYFPELIRPWRNDGHYALILGQVAGDAALATLPGHDLNRFYYQLARDVGQLGLPIRFRPHPKSITMPPKLSLIGGSLTDALDKAAVAITFNSNSAVDAVLAGVPAITLDPGAMAWPVTTHDFSTDLIRPDRLAWASRIAWSQWSLEEIAAGAAWDRLRAGMVGLNNKEEIGATADGIDQNNSADSCADQLGRSQSAFARDRLQR